MSGNKCAYYHCGRSSRNNPGLRKFTFPVHDEKRCIEWIRNSGNFELSNLSPKSLKKQFLCGSHFDEKHVLKKGISLTAVPVPYNDIENVKVVDSGESYIGSCTSANYDASNDASTSGGCRMQPFDEVCFVTPTKRKREISPSSTTSHISDGDDICTLEDSPANSYVKETPTKIKLKRKLNILYKKHRSQSSLLSQFKSKKQKTVSSLTPREFKTLSPFSQALVRMQLFHKARTPFLKDEKKVAISMYYKSPGLYHFLRKNKVILPSVSSVKKWISDFDVLPGFQKKLFNRIKLKVQTMTEEEKRCIVMFDEMDIKQFLDYSKKYDIIEGFENLVQFGASQGLAKKVLVILVRGIYSHWKLPIAYFFSETAVSASKLKEIVTTALHKLETISLNPLATVCDGSTTNQKLYKLLNVSVTNPYFILNDKKYYAIFDVPHLIKCVRNNLLNGDFLFENNIISMEVIRDVANLDRDSSTGKSLLKITEKHLKPNPFEKLSVKFATQLFSNSMSAAIRTAVRTKEVHESAIYTAEFVEKVDKLFDALNSQQLYAVKPWNTALSLSNKYAYNAIMDGYKLFFSLVKQSHKDDILTKPPCFQNILQTINAINLLFLDSLKEGFTFIFTRRLNQDPIENLFSVYRQSGGYNRNPTAKAFRAAFKINITINLLKPPQSNCEEDEDVMLQHDELSSNHESELNLSSSLSTSSTNSEVSSYESDSEFTLKNSSEGYLCKKVLDKYKCNICKEFLEDDLNQAQDKNECLIFLKNFNIGDFSICHLKVPSPILKSFTKISMYYFSKYFVGLMGKSKISKKLKNQITNKLRKHLSDWFVYNKCKVHRSFLLELLIRTLIFKDLKYRSLKAAAKKNRKKSDKLTILKNK